MNLCSMLVDSFADEGLTNAQMSNAREIICRLDPRVFYVTVFHMDAVDERIANRPNTSLIHVGKRRQSVTILKSFLSGKHDIVFYIKASPSAKWYMRLRSTKLAPGVTVGTVESRSNLSQEPTISPEAVRLWEQTVLRCDFLFSNSTAVAEHLLESYGRESEVIPTGVNSTYFTPSDRERNERPRVLFVGSLRPFKRPDLLLDAAARFPHADFVIVGDGMMKAQLDDRVRTENLRNVLLLGALDANAVRTEYQNADIFLFPSKWEGSPKVILEAAACGLPVIARRDYCPETVFPGVTGFLEDSDDLLLARVEQLLRNGELRRRMGAAGRILSQKFDWDKITDQWQEAFLRVWKDKPGMRAA